MVYTIQTDHPSFSATLLLKYQKLTLLRVRCCHNLAVGWRRIPWLRGWCRTCLWRRCIPHWRGWTIACWWGWSISWLRGWGWSISWLRGWGWSIPWLRGWWWVVYNHHCLLFCSLLPGQSPSVEKHVVNAASKNQKNYDSNDNPNHNTTGAAT